MKRGSGHMVRFVSGALVLLAGCARFQSQPISPSQTAAELESRSLTNAALKTFLERNLNRDLADWPASRWDFDMLTLAAFYFHPDLELARAQWKVAQAAIRTAGGRPNPTLSLVPGYDTTTSIPSPWIPSVTFDVPIETAGKRGRRILAAEQLSESARLNIATVAWQVRSRLRSSLLEFAAARRRGELLEQQVSLQEQIVKVLGEQIQAGAMAGSEQLPARIALQKLRVDLNDARIQCADARARVAAAIGISVAALDPVDFSFDLLPQPASSADLTSASLRRAALQSRADILSALAEYAAAEATLQLEIAKQYPDVHLSPGYQYDQGDNKWSLGITFDLPVLNQNQGPIAEAKARREEAAAKFNALQAQVLAQIERAADVFRVSESNSATLRSLADEQAKQRDSVEAQFKAGGAGQLELLGARLEFGAAMMAELDGQVKLRQAVAALEDAVQRPMSGEMNAAITLGEKDVSPEAAPAKKTKR